MIIEFTRIYLHMRIIRMHMRNRAFFMLIFADMSGLFADYIRICDRLKSIFVETLDVMMLSFKRK